MLKKLYTTLDEYGMEQINEVKSNMNAVSFADVIRRCIDAEYNRMQKIKYGYKGSNQKVNKQELEIEARNKIKDMAENDPDGLTKYLYDIDYIKDELLDTNPNIQITFNVENDPDTGTIMVMGKYNDLTTGRVTSKFSLNNNITHLINDLKKEGKLI